MLAEIAVTGGPHVRDSQPVGRCHDALVAAVVKQVPAVGEQAADAQAQP